MIKYNRTENSIRSTLFGVIFMLINTVGSFAVRTVLIYVLGIEYVGLEGLFSSILTILNMAELGFSTAIVFKLYKPIAEGDVDTVCALLKYYRKIYRNIGIAIAVVGTVLLPFLKHFINGEIPPSLNVYVLYILYLLNTCLTYWLFAYKTAILNAHQRNDYVSKVSGVVCLIKHFFQIALLLLTKNYYIYIVIIPLSTLLINIGNALIARKHYPQYICRGDLGEGDKQEIREKIRALFLNKIGVSIINGSDNIVISSFLGIGHLGIYTSYYYIINTLYNVFSIFHSAVTAGIGNKMVTEDVSDNYLVFNNLMFINFWASSWVSICLFCLYKPFISVWLGADHAYSPLFSALMALYFFFWMIRFPVIIFKNAQGLWKEDCMRPFIEGVLNLCLNLIMVRIIGIYGIVLSTIAAMIIVSLPWETKVLFTKYFGMSSRNYYRKLALYILTFILVGMLTYAIGSIYDGSDVLAFIYKVAVCLIIPNVIYVAIFLKKDGLKEVFRYIESLRNR